MRNLYALFLPRAIASVGILYALMRSRILQHHIVWALCALLGLFASFSAQAQVTISLQISERDNLTTTPAGSLVTVRLNYSISSTTGNATGVKAVLNLPDDVRNVANLVGTVHAPIGNFVFDGTPGAKKLTINFIEPVPSGSTGAIDIGAYFKNGTIPNNTLQTFTAVLTDGSGNTSGVQTLPITVTANPSLCVNKTLLGGGAIDGLTQCLVSFTGYAQTSSSTGAYTFAQGHGFWSGLFDSCRQSNFLRHYKAFFSLDALGFPTQGSGTYLLVILAFILLLVQVLTGDFQAKKNRLLGTLEVISD